MKLTPTHQLICPKSELHRVQRGVFSDEQPRNPKHKHVMRVSAALLHRKGLYLASHVSAAVLHGLPMFDEDLSTVHLTCAKPSRRGKKAKVHVHEAPTDEFEVLHGVPVTPLARTLIDCARSIPRDQAVAMLDYALHEGKVTKDDLIVHLGKQPQWHLAQARKVIDLSDGRAESVGESRSRLIMLDAGLQVTPQVWVRDREGAAFARVDLVVDGLPLAVEFEGREKARKTGDGGRANKERNDNVEDHGWVVVPMYWEHLDDPESFMARVHRGIRRAQRLMPLAS